MSKFSRIMLDKESLKLIKEGKKMLNKFFQSSIILAFEKTMTLFIKFLFSLVNFWNCAANIALGLAKLAGRLMKISRNLVPGRLSRLYFIKCLQLLTPYRRKSLVYLKSHFYQNKKWN